MAGEVSFTLSEADYLAANRHWFIRTLRQPRVLARTGTIIALAALAAGAVSLIIGSDAADAVFVTAGMAFYVLIFLLVIYIGCYLTLPGRIRRIYAQQKSMGQPWRYAWSEEGLDFSSPAATSRLAWTDMYRWSEGPQSFLFFTNELSFHPIPRRVLTTGQQEDLRTLAARLGPQLL